MEQYLYLPLVVTTVARATNGAGLQIGWPLASGEYSVDRRWLISYTALALAVCN